MSNSPARQIPTSWPDEVPAVCGGIGSKHTDEPGKEFRRPYLKVTLADIRRLADKPGSVPKENAPWIIPSTFPSRTFETQRRQGSYPYLWADVDSPPGPFAELARLISDRVLRGRDAEFYTSRSATVEKPKFRVLVPLKHELTYGAWNRCQIIFSLMLRKIGIETDHAAHGSGQLCYLPNAGEFYENHSQRGGVLLDPARDWGQWLADLALREQQHAEQQQMARHAAAEARRATFRAVGGSDIIGQFNRSVSVESLLIDHGYQQKGSSADWRHQNSESGSYSLRVIDGRVFSLSPADPLYSGGAGGHSLDSFEVFTRLACGGDKREAVKKAKGIVQ